MSPAFNFQAQFADAVESGEKRQTIRKLRKDGRDPKVGDTLYLYTGMRTKACRKLGEAVCTSRLGVQIGRYCVLVRKGRERWIAQNNAEVASLAQADGFESFAEMRDWFEKTHGLPFTGKLYRWAAPTAPSRT